MTPGDIDEPCRELVREMNLFPGIRTVESCSGHGERPMRVFFVTDSLEALPALVYWFSACHSGVRGWKVTVSTDCVCSPAMFCAGSEQIGAPAYAEARQIAASMASGREREERDE